MEGLGEKLRGAREQKGVNTSEAAKATRIKVQHIEALENEEFDKMAAPIYVKGFLKLYAEYLELDPDELIAEYSSQNAPLSPDQIVGSADRNEHPGKPREGKGTTGSTPGKSGQTAQTASAAIAKLLLRLKNRAEAIDFSRIKWKQMLTIGGGILVALFVFSSIKNCVSKQKQPSEQKNTNQIELIEDVPPPYIDKDQLSAYGTTAYLQPKGTSNV